MDNDQLFSKLDKVTNEIGAGIAAFVGAPYMVTVETYRGTPMNSERPVGYVRVQLPWQTGNDGYNLVVVEPMMIANGLNAVVGERLTVDIGFDHFSTPIRRNEHKSGKFAYEEIVKLAVESFEAGVRSIETSRQIHAAQREGIKMFRPLFDGQYGMDATFAAVPANQKNVVVGNVMGLDTDAGVVPGIRIRWMQDIYVTGDKCEKAADLLRQLLELAL